MPITKSNTRSATLDSTNLRKNFVWNTIGSTVASFASLFYMMIVTRLNGIEDAGIFSFAFSTAAFFLIIGTYSGRTFQVTDKNHKTTDSDYFYMKIVTCVVMLIVGFAFCLFRRYNGDKFMIIMFLVMYRMLEAIAESAYAVIQKKDRLYQVGRSMFIKSISSLIGFLVIDYITHNIALSCAIIIISHLLAIVFYDLPKLAETGFHFEKLNPKKVQYLLKIGFFAFGFNFLNLYVINSARYALDSVADDGAQTVYGIIAMPATILSLVGQYLIQPFLTSLKKLFATNAQGFQNLVMKLCFALFGIGIFCTLAALALGIPVLELLYAIDLSGNLPGLLLIIIGGTFGSFVLVLSTALVTMRRTGDQFIVICLVSVIMLGLSHILVEWQGTFGAFMCYMLAMILLSVIYFGVFMYRMRNLKRNFTQEVQRAAQE